MSLLPDEYEFRARLRPLFLIGLPAALAALCFIPSVLEFQIVGGLLVYCGVIALLAQLGRDLGKLKEPQLFEAWGGKPTTLLLRHHAGASSPATRQRYHRALENLMADLRLPSVSAELAEPAAAYATYDSCVAFLRERTRDKKAFPLIFAENINYGFRRNLWALKPAACVIALASLILSGMALANAIIQERFVGLPITATLINGCLLTFWLLRFTPAWVRIPAFAYAERLLGACDVLPANQSQKQPLILPQER